MNLALLYQLEIEWKWSGRKWVVDFDEQGFQDALIVLCV